MFALLEFKHEEQTSRFVQFVQVCSVLLCSLGYALLHSNLSKICWSLQLELEV